MTQLSNYYQIGQKYYNGRCLSGLKMDLQNIRTLAAESTPLMHIFAPIYALDMSQEQNLEKSWGN